MVAPARSNRTLRHPRDVDPASPTAEEYPLSPDDIEELDAAKRALAVARLEAAAQRVDEQLRPRPWPRVSREFAFFLSLGVIGGLMLSWNLRPEYLAAACGMTAMAWVIGAWLFRLQSAYVEWTWWAILTMYVVAVIRAAYLDG
ncbi:MAG: hypothetical protein JSS27_16015 [Planctomycetes bacterium]|nr:hypothetical protein [Planctomycetota bacterium]